MIQISLNYQSEQQQIIMINKRILYKVIPQKPKKKNVKQINLFQQSENDQSIKIRTQRKLNLNKKITTKKSNKQQSVQLRKTKRQSISQTQCLNEIINTIRKNQNFKQSINQIKNIKQQNSCKSNIAQRQVISNCSSYYEPIQNNLNQCFYNNQQQIKEKSKIKLDNTIFIQEYQQIIEINWNQTQQKIQILSPEKKLLRTSLIKEQQNIQKKQNEEKYKQKELNKKITQQQNQFVTKKQILNKQSQNRIQRFLNHLNAKIIQQNGRSQKEQKRNNLKGKIKRQKSLAYHHINKKSKFKQKSCSLSKHLKYNYLSSNAHFNQQNTDYAQSINFCSRKQNNQNYDYSRKSNFELKSSIQKNNYYQNRKVNNLKQCSSLQNSKFRNYPNVSPKNQLIRNTNNVSPIRIKKTQLFEYYPGHLYPDDQDCILSGQLNKSNKIEEEIIKTPKISKTYEPLNFQREYYNLLQQDFYENVIQKNYKQRPQSELARIFMILDENRSGIITKNNYGIQNISEQLQNILISVTNRINYLNKQYSKNEFVTQVWDIIKNVYYSFVRDIIIQQIYKSETKQQIYCRGVQQQIHNRDIRHIISKSTTKRQYQRQNYVNINNHHLNLKFQNSSNSSFNQLFQPLFLMRGQQAYQNKCQKNRELREIQRLDRKLSERIHFFTTKIRQFSQLNCY